MTDHERIWLEPECCAAHDTGRSWCQDRNPWEHYCGDSERQQPTEYVRADLYADLEATLNRIRDIVTDPKSRSLRWSIKMTLKRRENQ